MSDTGTRMASNAASTVPGSRPVFSQPRPEHRPSDNQDTAPRFYPGQLCQTTTSAGSIGVGTLVRIEGPCDANSHWEWNGTLPERNHMQYAFYEHELEPADPGLRQPTVEEREQIDAYLNPSTPAWSSHPAMAGEGLADGEAAPSVLADAESLIYGDRERQYGPPTENLTRIASLWSPILGGEVSPEQVALCMLQVKVSRMLRGGSYGWHRDSVVDAAGYVGCLERLHEENA